MELLLNLYSYPQGAPRGEGTSVSYEIDTDRAHFGPAATEGRTLRFELGGLDTGDQPTEGGTALLSRAVALDPSTDWIVRCDRVDFPPGGIAYRHVHPGPGIRCLLFGELTVDSGDEQLQVGPLQAWFESGPEPVLATASTSEPSAFVRVMLLPESWRGQRTIRYVDPADAELPRRQRATVYFDQSLPARTLQSLA